MVIPYLVINYSKMQFQILYNSLLKISLFVLLKGSGVLFPSISLTQKMTSKLFSIIFCSWEKEMFSLLVNGPLGFSL